MKEKLIILKTHSVVDLITNSSTTIFTYSDGSESAVKTLIDEMLKVFNVDKTADDLFYFGVFLEDDYNYFEYEEDDDEEGFELTKELLEETKIKVLKGEIKKPEWMEKREDYRGNYDNYSASTNLTILAKDEKYNELASRLIGYLYSTGHEAEYQG